MKELLTQFIADYLDGRTRPHAQANLLRNMEVNSLIGEDMKLLVTRSMTFVDRYHKAWPWNRRQVIAQSLRGLIA